MDWFFDYLSGENFVFGIIAVTLILFIAAIIRYLFDRSGGYF